MVSKIYIAKVTQIESVDINRSFLGWGKGLSKTKQWSPQDRLTEQAALPYFKQLSF